MICTYLANDLLHKMLQEFIIHFSYHKAKSGNVKQIITGSIILKNIYY